MVPHLQILQAIALVAHAAGSDAGRRRKELCELHRVKYPFDFALFWADLNTYLPSDVAVRFLTTDIGLTHDVEPLFYAAKALGLEDVVTVNHQGPTVYLPDEVMKWRDHDTIRVAMETMCLCGISPDQISEDFRTMFGWTFEESYVSTFRDLYADPEHATKEGMAFYAKCMGLEETAFKMRLLNQPHDFVRWKLGVPVQLDIPTVLARLVSDGYYAERLIKHDSAGAELSRTELSRIKMERDTIFKAIDRMQKQREVEGTTGGDSARAHARLRSITLQYENHEFTTKDDLGEDAKDDLPLIEDLE